MRKSKAAAWDSALHYFTRVPAKGECIAWDLGWYLVENVAHAPDPDAECDAEVFATLTNIDENA